MKKSDFLFIFFSFLAWKIILFVFLFIAVSKLPLQQNFLGGGMFNYLTKPWLWGWVNFDGEHYLSLARVGYQPLTYFYFPFFPIVSGFLAKILGGRFEDFAVAGLIVSNLSFLIGLIGFWKLVDKEFGKKVARVGVLLLLFFPTSFYFGSYYTESLYFALTMWSFYFIRNNKWLYGGVLGGVSSATRIIGIALLPAFLAEFFSSRRKSYLKLISVLLVTAGIALYMYYLKVETGDPLNFFNTVSIFGAQRSSNMILLPQVFYRYFFRILPYINYRYLPGVFVAYLELFTGIAFLGLSILAFWKLRLSYSIYLALGFLIPTLSGSFSSLPRYVIVLFPGFILLALYISKLTRSWKIVIFSLLFVGLGLATSLFVRGYWIS